MLIHEQESRLYMAKLVFYYGVMSSGKSNELIGTYYKYTPIGKKVVVLKPSVDTKGENTITSRSGSSLKVDALILPDQSILEHYHLLKDAFVVLVDEAQFLTKEQIFELWVITKQMDLPIIAYGLRSDFKGKLFEGSKALFQYADSLREMKGVCKICGKTSTRNARKVNGAYVYEGEQVVIGADESYDPLCSECYIDYVLEPYSIDYQKILTRINFEK